MIPWRVDDIGCLDHVSELTAPVLCETGSLGLVACRFLIITHTQTASLSKTLFQGSIGLGVHIVGGRPHRVSLQTSIPTWKQVVPVPNGTVCADSIERINRNGGKQIAEHHSFFQK